MFQNAIKNIYTTLNDDVSFVYRYTHNNAYAYVNGHLVCVIQFLETVAVAGVYNNIYKTRLSLLNLYYTLSYEIDNVFNIVTNLNSFTSQLERKNEPSLFSTG